jgi:hypothetical protein
MSDAAQIIQPEASDAAVPGDIDDFCEACSATAWFYSSGWIDLHTAVDNLQWLAARWALIERYGQDEIQAVMALALDPEPFELPFDYSAQILRQWELAGPPQAVNGSRARPQPHSTPDSVVDAFFFVARQGDAKRLAKWLADHPADKAELFKLWKAKRC